MERTRKPRVLVCDDEAGVRESLKMILGDRYEVTYLTNGREALDHLREHAPDLAILDIKMPQLGGMEILREIKAGKLKVRVLMISGYESMDVAAQAIQLGADDYVAKPFDRAVVEEKLRVLLDR